MQWRAPRELRKALTDDANKEVLPMLQKVLERLQPHTSNEDVPWAALSEPSKPLHARHKSSLKKRSRLSSP